MPRHVTDPQGDDDSQGEERGQDDGGGGFGGFRSARGDRERRRDAGGAQGTSGDDGVAPTDGHADNDPGEHAVHHGFGAELGPAQVDQGRGGTDGEGEEAEDNDRAEQVWGDHDRAAIASSAPEP